MRTILQSLALLLIGYGGLLTGLLGPYAYLLLWSAVAVAFVVSRLAKVPGFLAHWSWPQFAVVLAAAILPPWLLAMAAFGNRG